MDNKVSIVLDKNNNTIDLLFNGYNFIAHTIYNKELTEKILTLIENELKNEIYDFESLEKLLTLK